MKFLVAIVFSLSSLTTLATAGDSAHNLSYNSAHSFEYFHGSGVFKKPSGKSANFLASLTIRKLAHGKFNFIYGMYLADKNKHYDIVLNDREGESFFDIMSDGDVIGYGYCIARKCHFEYSRWGHDIEETIYRDRSGNAISHRGSKRNKHGIVKSWKISLKKIF